MTASVFVWRSLRRGDLLKYEFITTVTHKFRTPLTHIKWATENLAKEAQRYGVAGSRPQVIWPNGVVASTAIGILVDLLTDWTKSLRAPVYLSYDGNRGTIVENSRLKYAPALCQHYPLTQVGAPVFRLL